MTDCVLVTEKEYGKAEAIFRAETRFRVEAAPAAEADLAAAVRRTGARAVIVGVEPYRGPLYESLAATGGARGGLIARFGVGHDGIDKVLARARGIRVTNTPGTLDESVAELALWLMGCLLRGIPACDSDVRRGAFGAGPGRELRGQRLCVVGFGGIGRRVAAMATFGFGMRVTAVGRRDGAALAVAYGRPLTELLAEWGAAAYTTDLAAAVGEADIVSLHLPVTAATRHLIDGRRLAAFKRGARLVNTARGALVDEGVLYEALASGRLAGAALDVYENEPYRPVAPDKDLRTLPNVVLTPHIGSNTIEANGRMARAALKNAALFLAGREDGLTRVDRA